MDERLLKKLSIVPNHRFISRCVEAGRVEYEGEMRELGIANHLSLVHPYGDVQLQAFALAIPSAGYKEMMTKSLLTYLSHIVDDHFDRPDLFPGHDLVAKHRRRPRELLKALGGLGEYALTTIDSLAHPDQALAAFQRIAYGSLDDYRFVNEHYGLSLGSLDQGVRREFERFSPRVISLTSKSVQGLLFAVDEEFKPEIAELWSLVFAPMLYYHDYSEEIENEGADYDFSTKELAKLVKTATNHLRHRKDEYFDLRQLQVRLLRTIIPLPSEVADAYVRLEEV